MSAFPLHYEMIQTRHLKFEVATHGRGDKLALLLHGFPESAHAYRHQIPLFERLGYRVWAPNLRGYGKSDKPHGRRAYALDQLESDVTDLIDAADARSVLLVGHDWGGAIAWSYAMRGPRELERLIVMNAPHPLRFEQALRTRAQLRRSWYMFFFQLPWLPEYLFRRDGYRLLDQSFLKFAVHPERFRDDDLASFRASASEPEAMTAMLNYYRALPYAFLGRRQGVRKITAPTLFLWGERDHALGRELTDHTDRLVNDLTLRFIPDASHWIQQDTPEAVNAHIEQWLSTPR